MKAKLDKTEKKLLASYRRGEWESVGKGAQRTYTGVARTQLKEKRVNIRLSEATLEKLRDDADALGIPYQTLASSILHRYAYGRMLDAQQIREVVRVLVSSRQHMH